MEFVFLIRFLGGFDGRILERKSIIILRRVKFVVIIKREVLAFFLVASVLRVLLVIGGYVGCRFFSEIVEVG